MQPSCSCRSRCLSDCPCRCARVFCGKACHGGGRRTCQPCWLVSQVNEVRNQGEEARLTEKSPIRGHQVRKNDTDGMTRQWLYPPALCEHRDRSGCESNTERVHDVPDCCQFLGIHQELGAHFRRVVGHDKGFSLYIQVTSYQNKISPFFKAQARDWRNKKLTVRPLLQRLSEMKKKPTRLFQCLVAESNSSIKAEGESPLPKLTALFHKGHVHRPAASTFSSVAVQAKISSSLLRSLKALSFAAEVYGKAETAPTPPRIVEQPLHEHLWIPDGDSGQTDVWKKCSQAHSFAWILTFESKMRCWG